MTVDLHHSHKVTSGDASRPGRSGYLPMEIILQRIKI